MPTFEQLRAKADNRKLIRKSKAAAAFVAGADVDMPESLWLPNAPASPTSLIDLIELGWNPLGMVTPDGYSFGREVETDEVNALGYASAVREDTIRVPRTIGATVLQSGQRFLEEIIYGTDLDGVTMNPVTGEVVFDEPDLPIAQDLKLLVVSKDGPTDEQWIRAKGYFAVTLSNGGSETWGQEGANSRELQFKVLTDEDSGVPVRHFLGGTGALKYQDVLGYDLAA